MNHTISKDGVMEESPTTDKHGSESMMEKKQKEGRKEGLDIDSLSLSGQALRHGKIRRRVAT